MNDNTIKTSSSIINNLSLGKIKDAIDLLLSLAEGTSNTEVLAKIENINLIYKSGLDVVIAGIEDPEKDRIKNKLIIDIVELTDYCREFMLAKRVSSLLYHTKQEINKTSYDIAERIENYLFIDALNHNIEIVDDKSRLEQLFKVILVTDTLSDGDTKAIERLFNSDVNSGVKCVIMSALTLSNLRFFHKSKVLLIANGYYSSIQEISIRSLFALLFTFYMYDFRLQIYPELNQKVTELLNDENFVNDIRMMMIVVLKTTDSKQATDKLKNEIIPEIKRMSPDLLNKIEAENFQVTDFNPEWLESSGSNIYEKLDELSSMQQSGFDIFIDAFSNLKNFPFFEKWSNWFIPFDSENSAIAVTADSTTKQLAKVINNIPFMCNSDKYSFVLNIVNMPSQQRDMLSAALSAQAEQLQIEKNDDMLFSKKELFLIPQHVQDLYRFFKLSSFSKNMPDLFKSRLDFHNKLAFKTIFTHSELINHADYYFKTKHFDKTLDILLPLIEDNYDDLDMFEKIAFCHQQLGQLQNAIEYYEKALQLGQKRLWTMLKLAHCYKNEGQTYDALRVYLEAATLYPDNTTIIYSLITTYMELDNYEKALQYIYKMEYFEPENNNIIRAMGWSKFVLGDFDTSLKYFNKLKQNRTDCLNIGHIFAAQHNLKEAIKYYEKSYKLHKKENKDFFKSFNDDVKYLLRNNVTQEHIDVITDYMKYKTSHID